MASRAERTVVAVACMLACSCRAADPRSLFRQRQVAIRSEDPQRKVVAHSRELDSRVLAEINSPGQVLLLASGASPSLEVVPWAASTSSRRVGHDGSRRSNATLLQTKLLFSTEQQQHIRQIRKAVYVLRWAVPVPPWRRHLSQPHVFSSYTDLEALPNSNSKKATLPKRSYSRWWLATFVVSVAVMGIYTKATHDKQLPSCLGRPSEIELLPEAGRPCYVYCFAAYMLLLSMATFLVALLVISAQNFEIESHPGKVIDEHGDVAQINVDPGADAYEAGVGVGLSVVMACVVIFSWRCSGDVRVSNASLAQFAVRGASLSLLIAALLEMIGEMMLNLTEEELEPTDRPVTTPTKNVEKMSGIWVVLLFLITGIAEELAKIIAVVWGLWFSESAMSNTFGGCCESCRMLLKSPRAVMLAGLSVGFAFMTIENAEYLLAVACIPTTVAAGESADDKETDAVATNVARLLVISVRVFLNIHPWLAGITSARVARLEFVPNRQTAGLTLKELSWALGPSAMAHAVYDIMVVVLPGGLAIFAPPVFWYAARAAFIEEWKNFESVSTEGVEDASPPAVVTLDNPPALLPSGTAQPEAVPETSATVAS